MMTMGVVFHLPAMPVIDRLVLQLARANDWGNSKIAGELVKLELDISDQTLPTSSNVITFRPSPSVALP
jgi:hypothetical protein